VTLSDRVAASQFKLSGLRYVQSLSQQISQEVNQSHLESMSGFIYK
jgi:hypothetical protein